MKPVTVWKGFPFRGLISLWLHCLIHAHQMAYVQRHGWHSPKERFCWQCDRNWVEMEIGENLPERVRP